MVGSWVGGAHSVVYVIDDAKFESLFAISALRLNRKESVKHIIRQFRRESDSRRRVWQLSVGDEETAVVRWCKA